jgi:hypothetical protein
MGNNSSSGGNSSNNSGRGGSNSSQGPRRDNNSNANSRQGNKREDNRRNDSRRDDSPRDSNSGVDTRRDEPRKVQSPNRDLGKKRKLSPIPNRSTVIRHSSNERDSYRDPVYSYITARRDVIELKQRHPKLHIPKDFTHVQCLWTNLPANSLLVNHHQPVECSSVISEESVRLKITKYFLQTTFMNVIIIYLY